MSEPVPKTLVDVLGSGDDGVGSGEHLAVVEAGTGTGKSFGALVPALVLATVMIILMMAMSVPLLGLPLPVNPLVLVLGLLLGGLMLVPAALVTANITRTVESAQVTSLPAMVVLMLGTGTLLPVELLPDWAARVMAILPSAPITALTRLGWLGIDAEGVAVHGTQLWAASAGQAAILIGWTLVGALIVREHFRWEPRG